MLFKFHHSICRNYFFAKFVKNSIFVRKPKSRITKKSIKIRMKFGNLINFYFQECLRIP